VRVRERAGRGGGRAGREGQVGCAVGVGGRAWERGGRELAGRGAGADHRLDVKQSRQFDCSRCRLQETARPRRSQRASFRAMDVPSLLLPALADVAGQGQRRERVSPMEWLATPPDAAVAPAALAGQQGNAVHPAGLAPPGQPAPGGVPGMTEQDAPGWSEHDVEQQAGLPVGRGKAHRFLQAWREQNPQGSFDLTNRRDDFDWVSYLANHPSRKLFFEGGRRVLRFGIDRIPAVMDTNTRDARVDYTMKLSDGIVIRLHPGTKTTQSVVVGTHVMDVAQQMVEGRHEAAPSAPRGKKPPADVRLQGLRKSRTDPLPARWELINALNLEDGRQGRKLETPVEAAAGGGGKGQGKGGIKGDGKGKAAGCNAVWQAAPLSPRGNDAAAPAPKIRHFEGISRADFYPTWAVKIWAEARLQASRQTGRRYKLDITQPVEVDGWRTGVFMWYLWFNNVKVLKNHVPNVEEIWLVVANNEPGFWIRVRAGGQFLVQFDSSGGVTVEAGWGNFNRQIAWE